MVADRENDRVQVFTQEGEHVTTWPTRLIGAALFYVDDEDTVYIPEHNGGLVSILTLEGERLAQWGSEIHRSCHGIWGGPPTRTFTWCNQGSGPPEAAGW